MPSIFSKLVAGELPCAKVWESEEFLAFLDISPVSEGHTLVIPKEEVDYLFDLGAESYGRLMEACRVISAGLKEATGCARVCLFVVGYEVPHAHVHLVPTNSLAEVPFPPRRQVTPDELAATAAKLNAALG